jgi:hypothetical protein
MMESAVSHAVDDTCPPECPQPCKVLHPAQVVPLMQLPVSDPRSLGARPLVGPRRRDVPSHPVVAGADAREGLPSFAAGRQGVLGVATSILGGLPSNYGNDLQRAGDGVRFLHSRPPRLTARSLVSA